jgi:hypothetical protein
MADTGKLECLLWVGCGSLGHRAIYTRIRKAGFLLVMLARAVRSEVSESRWEPLFAAQCRMPFQHSH